MPIPSKRPNEKQSDFMIRCVPQLMKYNDKSHTKPINITQKLINIDKYHRNAINSTKLN